MGAFNTLLVDTVCPNCGKKYEMQIQYKYGVNWLYTYHIGDTLEFNDKCLEGKPEYKLAVVSGWEKGCPHCKSDGKDFEIFVEYGVITHCREESGEYDFVKTHGAPYIFE